VFGRLNGSQEDKRREWRELEEKKSLKESWGIKAAGWGVSAVGLLKVVGARAGKEI